MYSVRYECGKKYNCKTDKEAFDYVRMKAAESEHLTEFLMSVQFSILLLNL
jgi:hypothetical protein